MIQDNRGNQYVWVPVEENSLIRSNVENEHYSEKDDEIREFIESVEQNGGFYIARYETSIFQKEGEEQYIAASMKDKMPWTNVNYSTAQTVATNSANEFGYEDCKTTIMNSYAWDTTLAWLDLAVANYATSLNYGNYSGEILYTGATGTDMVQNICDMAGNVKEWTSEVYKDKENSNAREGKIVRGGNANLSRTASSRAVYEDTKKEINLGFRMILYRNLTEES